MTILQELGTKPPSSRARGALRPGSYQVGESVGRVSAVLNESGADERPILDCGAVTALGQRSTNEDEYFSGEVSLSVKQAAGAPGDLDGQPVGAWMVAVADGMGGSSSGALASRLAIDVFGEHVGSSFPLSKNASMSPLALQHFGDLAIAACQRALVAEVERNGDGALPGTTLTSGIVAWPYLYLFHVGDSRCYLLRGLELLQLTHDHTVYAEIIRTGLPAEGAPPSSGRMQRSSSGAKVDTTVVKLNAGDILLFCTDGVTTPTTQEALHAVLAGCSAQSAQQTAERLVQNALNHGGADNATAVVVKL